MPRLLIVLALAVLVLAGAQPARAEVAATTFDYTVRDRFPPANAQGIATEPNSPAYVKNVSADIDVTICIAISGSASFVWTLDGATFASGAGKCAATVTGVTTGTHHTLAATVTQAGLPTATYRRDVFIKDYLVAGIGDSIGSGEGNPERAQDIVCPGDVFCRVNAGPQWADSLGGRNCHRSTKAGQALAAKALEDDTHTGVKFIHLACSGATIKKLGAHELISGDPIDEGGLLESYVGKEPIPPARPAQLDELDELTCSRDAVTHECTGHKRIDALMISIGGNDVHFGDVVRFCWQKDCDVSPANNALVNRLNGDFDALAYNLRLLKAAIDSRLNVGRVYLSEYPDPTRGPGGASAPLPGILGQYSSIVGVSPHEADFVQRRLVQPLNALLAWFARDNGWTLVDGIEQAFIPHGYASGQDRWVETIEDSRWIQGPWCFPIGCLDLPAGTVHPNETGHRAIANLTVPKLRRPAPTFALGETGGAAVQPGQAFELRLPVTNTSTEAGADDVRGTLVGSDPGLSLTQTSAFYPALAPGATATSTNAFTGTVASGTPCGTDLGLTVEVTAAPGDSYRRPLRWFDRVLQVGGTGPLLAGSTTGPGVPAVIPEGDVADGKTGPMSTASVLTVPLAVTGSGPVHDVSLKIDELRGAVGPLKLELVAPNKRKVTVFDGGDRVPRPLTTPKTPGTDMLGATFAKAGGALPVSGNAPLSGTYAVPELAAFDALEARGTWKLVVSNYGASPVTLKGWSAPTHVAVC